MTNLIENFVVGCGRIEINFNEFIYINTKFQSLLFCVWKNLLLYVF